MKFEPIPTSRIPWEWASLVKLLAPAIARDKAATIQDVFGKLASGQAEASIITAANAHGVLVSEICVLDGVQVCWASYIAGSVMGGPREWLLTMRALMAEVETMAKAAHCKEVRIGGRDWSRVFPGYERFDDKPNRLRKVL